MPQLVVDGWTLTGVDKVANEVTFRFEKGLEAKVLVYDEQQLLKDERPIQETLATDLRARLLASVPHRIAWRNDAGTPGCLCMVVDGLRYPEVHCPLATHPPLEVKTGAFCWCVDKG